MYKKILVINALLMLTFSFLGCQKQDSANTDLLDQKVESISHGEPLTLENIQKSGTVESLQKITFKNNQISITPQEMVKDGKLVYPPLIINQELNLIDGTKIRKEDNQAIIEIKDKGAWVLTDGQTLNLETNAIEGAST